MHNITKKKYKHMKLEFKILTVFFVHFPDYTKLKLNNTLMV